MHLALTLVEPKEIEAAIAEARQALGSEVVDILYELGEDESGDPGIFYRIVLKDAYSRGTRLGEVKKRLRAILDHKLDQLSKWGVIAHFSYRNESEHAELRNRPWL
ncbi:MAG: hypothetical protein FJW39_11130 [Acidobacteria bacterium]|nr:hypothetical protein [Acidobacteriota bacterium]